ncbi:MAG: PDGLE domain-containing protein [Ilumatobacteraceae bacterium]
MSMKLFVVAGIAVAIALVVLIAPRANSNPDGLERVAIDHGIDAGAQDHDLAASPFADYGVGGVDNDSVGTALAGIVGVVLVFGIGYGLFAATKRLGSR